MKSKITTVNIQDLNTMTDEQRKLFLKLMNEELSKPENQKIIDEINKR
jgi:hypothetical protein